MKKFSKILAVLLLVVLALTTVGCGEKEQEEQTPKLVVGTSADYAPYEFHMVVDGSDKIVGFEMEAIRYIGAELGMEVEIVDMDFDGLLGAVQSGAVDCAMAAMSTDDERRQAVDFTDYYYTGVQLLLIRAEDADKYTSFESLAGAVCGIQNGTIHEQLAIDNIPDVEIKAYKTTADMAMELKNGMVDVLALDGYVARAYAEKYDDLLVPEIAFETIEGDQYAIAVKKGNTELAEKLNEGIAKMLASGKMDAWVLEANDQMLEESAG